jgi:hypothetical protein
VTVNALVLSGLQTVEIAEVFRRSKHRHFCIFSYEKTDQTANRSNFHSRVRPIVVEEPRERDNEFSSVEGGRGSLVQDQFNKRSACL